MKKARKYFGLFSDFAIQRLLKLHQKIITLLYKKVSYKEKLKTHVDKGLVKPERATAENALQAEYKYTSPTKYGSKLLTGIINNRFTEKGSAWTHVVNEKDKRVWTREFYRITPKILFDRLIPYAIVAKNIADGRPDGMFLAFAKNSETEYVWKSKNGKKVIPFDLRDYFTGLTHKQITFVKKNESNRNSYLRRTESKVTRQRTFQKKWK